MLHYFLTYFHTSVWDLAYPFDFWTLFPGIANETFFVLTKERDEYVVSSFFTPWSEMEGFSIFQEMCTRGTNSYFERTTEIKFPRAEEDVLSTLKAWGTYVAC